MQGEQQQSITALLHRAAAVPAESLAQLPGGNPWPTTSKGSAEPSGPVL